MAVVRPWAPLRRACSARQAPFDFSRAIDTHVHLFDATRFPVPPDNAYQPRPVTPEKLNTDLSRIPYRVVVHPSVYKHDNAPELQAVVDLGKDRTRAVVVFDPHALPLARQVRQWHDQGVRGVRINLASVGADPDEKQLTEVALAHADLIREVGWALDFHIHLSQLGALSRIIPKLNVPVVIDHFGGPHFPTHGDPPGFKDLLQLVASPQDPVYVKISAPYRYADDWTKFQPLFQNLYRAAPDRLVFATDYPHTRFEDKGIDAQLWMAMIAEWAMAEGGQTAFDKVFRTNAAKLFDFPALQD